MENATGLAELYKALAAAQAKMGRALKNVTNSHFRSKYADLGAVQEACFPALNEAGIAVIQRVGNDEGGGYVETILAHASGANIACRVRLIVQKNDMQGMGSAITYARRYGLMSMAGIAPEDDDGNAAANAAPTKVNPTSEGLRDAWRDGVLDRLPENATDRQKAEAFAEAIEADFGKYKSEKGLNGCWAKHQKLIDAFQSKHHDLYENLLDAVNARLADLSEPTDEAA